MKFQKVLEALADKNRRRILEMLKNGSLSVSEIQKEFSISGASLSHHLAKLKSADLVLSERRGQKVFYSIHSSVFEDVAKHVSEFFNLGGSYED